MTLLCLTIWRLQTPAVVALTLLLLFKFWHPGMPYATALLVYLASTDTRPRSADTAFALQVIATSHIAQTIFVALRLCNHTLTC